MTSNRSLLAAAVCALPLSIAACGGGSDTITPEGTHHGYVVSSASVPTTDAQARDFGLDLGSKTSSKQDGMVNNALGQAITALSMLNFDIQGTVTTAVDTGSIDLLIDFQTKDFANASAAGFGIKIGTMPSPAACSSPTDMVCRHHLDGSATFQIAADSPDDVVAGAIVNGTFNGGPGDLTLEIAIGSATAPIKLNLVRARVRATAISETGLTAIVGGLVTQDQLMNQIGPAIQTQVTAILARDCTPPGPAPGCGCHGTGATVISFDTNGDCMLSTAEILNNPVVKGLLLPDSCSMDSCKTADSLGIGVKVQAVAAKFPM